MRAASGVWYPDMKRERLGLAPTRDYDVSAVPRVYASDDNVTGRAPTPKAEALERMRRERLDRALWRMMGHDI